MLFTPSFVSFSNVDLAHSGLCETVKPQPKSTVDYIDSFTVSFRCFSFGRFDSFPSVFVSFFFIQQNIYIRQTLAKEPHNSNVRYL